MANYIPSSNSLGELIRVFNLIAADISSLLKAKGNASTQSQVINTATSSRNNTHVTPVVTYHLEISSADGTTPDVDSDGCIVLESVAIKEVP